MDFEKQLFEDVAWINLAQYRMQWRVQVKHLIPFEAGNFLATQAVLGFLWHDLINCHARSTSYFHRYVISGHVSCLQT